jgi:hypothetical protein
MKSFQASATRKVLPGRWLRRSEFAGLAAAPNQATIYFH